MADAVQLLRRAVALEPQAGHLRANLALALNALGQPEEALAAADAAIKLGAAADAFSHQGEALRQLSRHPEALASFETATAMKPDLVRAHLGRAAVLRALERPQEALESYERALVLQPGSAEAAAASATLLLQLGRPAEARVRLEASVARNPDAGACNNLAAALLMLGLPEEALLAADRGLSLAPDLAATHATRAAVLLRLARYGEALEAVDRAIELHASNAEAHNVRGAALVGLDRAAEALASYAKAIELQPGRGRLHSNLAAALLAVGAAGEALASLDRALALAPASSEAHGNRGKALLDLGRVQDAIASFDRAIELGTPDAAGEPYVDAYWNKSLALLLAGDYARGWPLYEWRKRRDEPLGAAAFDAPLWTGEQEVAGRTIYLHPEQGLGDTIQLCRYAPRLADRGAKVILAAPEPLRRLLESLDARLEVVSAARAPDRFDCHCPLGSLPLAFGTTVETIPAASPYLHARADLEAAWKDRLGDRSRRRIGLVWRGNPGHKNDFNRSIPLDALGPLLAHEAAWISLQKDLGPAETSALGRFPQVRSYADQLSDFAETAALIAQLDLVITVDTSVAHLAGALGKPVWILLPFNPDWRWLLDRDDTPWYPSARLFRQPGPGDWATVAARVAEALAPSA